ncbi:MAG: DUF2332 family protein [Pseudomonadota bacterium]
MTDREAAVRAAFIGQAKACAGLGSAFTAHLCEQFAANLTSDTAIGAKCLTWSGDPAISADNVPLRLCGGLHAQALTNRAPALAEAYGNAKHARPSWDILHRILQEQSDFLCLWVERPPQTNEVSRAAALWAGFMTISALTQKPLALVELGASAGLNLQADRFSYNLGGHLFGDAASAVRLKPEWKGKPPHAAPISIMSRAGCDLSPLDPSDDDDALRLTAYVWPDQPERLARLEAALSIARQHPVCVEAKDALVFLEGQLEHADESVCTVIYSTVAWQYLPPQAQDEGAAMIARHGIRLRQGALAWLRMEADGNTPGAGIDLILNPGHTEQQNIPLGRAHFHGAWVEWQGFS